MTPRASIVVPTRGGVRRLPYLFEALRAQTETSWEAIVVVDGDIDGTVELLDRMSRELPISPLVFPENRGRSAALSAGFDAATGEVLIRCDDDLRPAENYVATHVAQHGRDPVGVIGLYRNVYPETPFARAYGIARDSQFRLDAYAAPADRRWRYWAGNVSVRRDTYARVGGYDDAFRAYGWEDVDWGYRLHTAGVPVVLAPELETPHHVAATTTEIRVTRAFHSGAARRTFEAKHGTAALGAPRISPGAWNRLVDRTARRNGLAELQRLASRADRTLDRLPRRLAEKRVAWLVESAALSGKLRPEEVSTDV